MEYNPGINDIKYYTLTSGLNKYVLPCTLDEKVDQRLMNQIFSNRLNDSSVESILVRNGKQINFSCDFTKYYKTSEDMLVRKKMLSRESFTHEELLSLSDSEVRRYKEILVREMNVKHEQSVESVDSFLGEIGKKEELEKLLVKKYHVSKVSHLKALNSEIKSACDSLKINEKERDDLLSRMRLI
jgi:hypothetical protein